MGRRRRKGEFFEFLTEVIKSPHGYIWGIIACLLFLALSEWFIPLLFHNEFDKIFHPLFQIPLRAMAVLSIIAALINWAKNFWLNSLQAPKVHHSVLKSKELKKLGKLEKRPISEEQRNYPASPPIVPTTEKSLYKIICQGIAIGHNPDEVKQNLAIRFKVAPEKFAPLFKGKVTIFKKTEDYEIALKYQAVLKKIGVLCTISGIKPKETQSKPETDYKFASNKQSFPETAKEKGYQFEQFVVNKFDRRYFTLKEWRSDKGIDGRYAESNKNPDLEFEFHLRTVRKTFAVECKWRQNYYRGGVEWAKKGQVARYNAFATKRQIPVFVIIGVGGTPDDPNDIFVVPLKVLKYPHAKAEYLAKWKKSGNKNFFFNTQTELLK